MLVGVAGFEPIDYNSNFLSVYTNSSRNRIRKIDIFPIKLMFISKWYITLRYHLPSENPLIYFFSSTKYPSGLNEPGYGSPYKSAWVISETIYCPFGTSNI